MRKECLSHGTEESLDLELRSLGRSAVKVSAIAMVVMSFGPRTGEEDVFRILDMALESGITLFDKRENCAVPMSVSKQGRSELILGNWLAARGDRTRVIVATKLTGPGSAADDMTHMRSPD
jgi:aryl-alcohol dehydrogenase-like predicted oxidoreductase